MINNNFTLFCLVNGELQSCAFPVSISNTTTAGEFKELIKGKKTNDFKDVDTDKLILWRDSIPDSDDNVNNRVLFSNIADNDKSILKATMMLSDVFTTTSLEEGTIRLLVQRPPKDQEMVFSVEIYFWPDKRIVYFWTVCIATASLDDLKNQIRQHNSNILLTDPLEIYYCNNGYSKAEAIFNDGCLRRLLHVSKISSRTTPTLDTNIRWIISLSPPTKKFTGWTLKEVSREYDLTTNPEPKYGDLEPFTDIRACSLETGRQTKIGEHLLVDVEEKLRVLRLDGANEATKSIVVSSFMVDATSLFHENLFLEAQRTLQGRRGHETVDFSVHSVRNDSLMLGVIEVKREDFNQGVAQNIVQLESALADKKRKREVHDLDGSEEPLKERKTYGFVTDGMGWIFVECTMGQDNKLSYRTSELPEKLNYMMDWKDQARSIFRKLVWLWERIQNEISIENKYSRKLSSSPSNRRIDL
ncbi:hypothetical protein FBU30_007673 [Linnemannia zychae]|nr:hypothetical protein FBU30_007673 [Linnemannia zychae]